MLSTEDSTTFAILSTWTYSSTFAVIIAIY